MLVEAGHEVTLLTRGKKPIDARIPDDTGAVRWRGQPHLLPLLLPCCCPVAASSLLQPAAGSGADGSCAAGRVGTKHSCAGSALSG